MPRLPPTFPFPSRTSMLLNLFVYVIFTILIPMEVASELLYTSLTSWMGLALAACAIVNGGLAVFWLRYFAKVCERLSR